MAIQKTALSRRMRVGLLGASSAVGAYALQGVFDDAYVGATIGGAATAVVVSRLPVIDLSGIARAAFIGAVAGYAGTIIAERFSPEDEEEDIPFRALMSLILGGGVGALSADGISPPEIKLIA